jgi:hypothetical protein
VLRCLAHTITSQLLPIVSPACYPPMGALMSLFVPPQGAAPTLRAVAAEFKPAVRVSRVSKLLNDRLYPKRPVRCGRSKAEVPLPCDRWVGWLVVVQGPGPASPMQIAEEEVKDVASEVRRSPSRGFLKRILWGGS